MAFDCFLKIDGIPGDSLDAQHKGEIELLSFSWGESNAATAAHGSGGGAGKAVMQDLRFTMRTGQASPRLITACSTGYPFKEATLTVRKAGAQQSYLKLKLTDLLVSNYLIGLLTPAPDGLLNPPSDRPTGGLLNPPSDRTAADPPGGVPTDSVSLNFTRLEVEYRPQLPDGSFGPPVNGMAAR